MEETKLEIKPINKGSSSLILPDLLAQDAIAFSILTNMESS